MQDVDKARWKWLQSFDRRLSLSCSGESFEPLKKTGLNDFGPLLHMHSDPKDDDPQLALKTRCRKSADFDREFLGSSRSSGNFRFLLKPVVSALKGDGDSAVLRPIEHLRDGRFHAHSARLEHSWLESREEFVVDFWISHLCFSKGLAFGQWDHLLRNAGAISVVDAQFEDFDREDHWRSFAAGRVPLQVVKRWLDEFGSMSFAETSLVISILRMQDRLRYPALLHA